MSAVGRVLGIVIVAGVIPACGMDKPSPDLPAVTTASPPGGTYSGSPTVTLTATDPIFPYGQNYPPTIYYSTDGVDPSVGGANTTAGQSPLGGIVFPMGTTTLKFFSVDSGGNVELLQSEVYIVN